MDNKTIHYDGTVKTIENDYEESTDHEPIEINEEIRKNIGGNPYIFE
ncbi:hypothetical protein [Lysinibacillus yapensis]|nr:hypothetical protein [Lysinibacillus yapensis]